MPAVAPLLALAVWSAEPEVVEALAPLLDGLANVELSDALEVPFLFAVAYSDEPAVLPDALSVLALLPEAPKVVAPEFALVASTAPLDVSPAEKDFEADAAFENDEPLMLVSLLLDPSLALKVFEVVKLLDLLSVVAELFEDAEVSVVLWFRLDTSLSVLVLVFVSFDDSVSSVDMFFPWL